MTNPLLQTCLDFDCNLDRTELTIALGKLRRVGISSLEDFISVGPAEQILGKSGKVADAISNVIVMATGNHKTASADRKRSIQHVDYRG